MSAQLLAGPEWREEGRRTGQAVPRRELPRAAPVKRAPWEPYIPVYFWLSGVAAGGWLAAASEDWFGEGERPVVRAGRYLAVSGMLGGTALLILDLGRPERFLHMLRLVQPRSAMSLGSWGLAIFGGATGCAAALQLAEDLLGPSSTLGRLSRGPAGRALHLAVLPVALFVGSYTGILLASTSTPAWARQRLTLPPLFLASGTASGLSATAALAPVIAGTGARTGAHTGGRAGKRGPAPSTAATRRLARASAAALAAELALDLIGTIQVGGLPSRRSAPSRERTTHALTLLLGTVTPLALLLRAASRPVELRGGRRMRPLSRRPGLALTTTLATALTLAGSLALRFRQTAEGYRSAECAADTWALTEARPLRNPA